MWHIPCDLPPPSWRHFGFAYCYEFPGWGFVAVRKTKRLRMAPIAFQSILSFQVGVDDSSKEDKMRQRPSQCPLEANLLLRIPYILTTLFPLFLFYYYVLRITFLIPTHSFLPSHPLSLAPGSNTFYACFPAGRVYNGRNCSRTGRFQPLEAAGLSTHNSR